jgi:hypothetical protein
MVEAVVDALPDTEDAVVVDAVAVTIAKLGEDVAIDAGPKGEVWVDAGGPKGEVWVDAGGLDEVPIIAPTPSVWELNGMMVW